MDAVVAATAILVAYVVLILAAGVVTALKGKWVTLVVGLVGLAGLPWLFGALRLAKPRSWWARRYYGAKTMTRAHTRAASRPYRILVAAGLLLSLLLVAALFALLKPYRISSAAMEPTLRCAKPAPGCSADASDRILALRFVLGLEPRRGDLVSFEATPESIEQCGTGGILVKRVVGLPGENISSLAGQILIDGEELQEDYVDTEHRGGRSIVETLTIPADHYFVLGDNRLTSCDSREYGPVPRENVVARVVFVYWPLSRIGLS
jgi:signal peptidase I